MFLDNEQVKRNASCNQSLFKSISKIEHFFILSIDFLLILQMKLLFVRERIFLIKVEKK